jgi:hypothetical protein
MRFFSVFNANKHRFFCHFPFNREMLCTSTSARSYSLRRVFSVFLYIWTTLTLCLLSFVCKLLEMLLKATHLAKREKSAISDFYCFGISQVNPSIPLPAHS